MANIINFPKALKKIEDAPCITNHLAAKEKQSIRWWIPFAVWASYGFAFIFLSPLVWLWALDLFWWFIKMIMFSNTPGKHATLGFCLHLGIGVFGIMWCVIVKESGWSDEYERNFIK